MPKEQIAQLPLTPGQEKALGVIRLFHEKFGMYPVASQLAALLGHSKSASVLVLKELERKGWIARTKGAARSMRVLVP